MKDLLGINYQEFKENVVSYLVATFKIEEIIIAKTEIEKIKNEKFKHQRFLLDKGIIARILFSETKIAMNQYVHFISINANGEWMIKFPKYISIKDISKESLIDIYTFSELVYTGNSFYTNSEKNFIRAFLENVYFNRYHNIYNPDIYEYDFFEGMTENMSNAMHYYISKLKSLLDEVPGNTQN